MQAISDFNKLDKAMQSLQKLQKHMLIDQFIVMARLVEVYLTADKSEIEEELAQAMVQLGEAKQYSAKAQKVNVTAAAEGRRRVQAAESDLALANAKLLGINGEWEKKINNFCTLHNISIDELYEKFGHLQTREEICNAAKVQRQIIFTNLLLFQLNQL
jgi:hypothetical protein